jgi:hypothetical protein
MTARRKLFLNDRVRAAFVLLIVMSACNALVFFGIETLKLLPTLSPEQQIFLSETSYPPLFKFLVILCFNGIAVMSAYLVLAYRYAGFFYRLSDHFKALQTEDKESSFRFRDKDRSEIFQDSMETLIESYRKKIWELEVESLQWKRKLSSFLNKGD